MARLRDEARVRYLHLGQSGIYTRELFRYLHQRDRAAGHLLLTRHRDTATAVGEDPFPGWVRVCPKRTAFLSLARRLGRMADKIIIHGLFDEAILALLAAAPDVRAKSTWVLWGGDLYGHLDPPSGIRQAAARRLRRYVIARIPQIATHIPGDADLCRTHFGWAGGYLNSITYVNTTVPEPSEGAPRRYVPDGRRPIRVLAGNSASPTNRIEDLLTRLASIDDGTMEVHCALAYGDDDVRREATELGQSKFGDRFHPILSMVPYPAYLDFLRTVDVAMFNHERQEAVGNILSLLSFGTRVFLHSHTTTWSLLAGLGVAVSDAARLHLEPLPVDVAERNARLVREAYGRQRLDAGLDALFAPIPSTAHHDLRANSAGR